MLSLAEIQELQDVQESNMQDEINLNHPVITYNSLGEQIKTFTVTSGISCGIEYLNNSTAYKGQIFSTPIDAILRISRDIEISLEDTVTVTNFKGETVLETFEINSGPRKGVSANRYNLKRTEI